MSGYIENLDEIDSKLDIEAVLKDLGHDPGVIKHTGKNEIRFRCPIHKGENPNFAFNKDTTEWFCHSKCGKGETGIINLHKRITGGNLPDTAEYLANKFGIPTKFKEIKTQKGKYKPEDVKKAWDEAKKIGEDLYFSKRGLNPPPGIRFGKNPYGFTSMLVPYIDIEGNLHNLTCIQDSGEHQKKIFKIDEKKGCFFPFADYKNSNQVIVGEGVATVQTAWEGFNKKIPAVSAGTWSNIVQVVRSLKEENYSLSPIILIDVDESGKGLLAALQVYKECPSARFLKPSFVGLEKRGTDFNDLMQIAGWEETRSQLAIYHDAKDLELELNAIKNLSDKTSQKESESSENKNQAVSFEYLLDGNSREHIIAELKNTSPGVTTGFIIGNEHVKIPGGAISVIAMPTSHGKTATLINLSLGALNHHHDKTVYFFTYEESGASILTLFLNTFINKELSKNNRESIKSYYMDGHAHYISEDKRLEFLSDEKAFFKNLIDTKRLNVFYSEMAVEELVSAIHFLKKNTNVGLVCIDYMQLLRSLKGSKGNRQEELKEICLMLKDCAIETGLPILLGAQFNRTVLAEADLSPTNIGEAGDIERIANLIIGGWNRNFEGFSRTGNIDKKGKTIAKESAIYFEIMKGRGIGNGHNCVMSFNGNSGKLSNQQKKSYSM